MFVDGPDEIPQIAVRLGIEAPNRVPVFREEVYARIVEANREAARASMEALTKLGSDEASEEGER